MRRPVLASVQNSAAPRAHGAPRCRASCIGAVVARRMLRGPVPFGTAPPRPAHASAPATALRPRRPARAERDTRADARARNQRNARARGFTRPCTGRQSRRGEAMWTPAASPSHGGSVFSPCRRGETDSAPQRAARGLAAQPAHGTPHVRCAVRSREGRAQACPGATGCMVAGGMVGVGT